MTRFILVSLALSLVACDHAAAPANTDAFVVADAPAGSCDARIGTKQASCGAPPSLAQLYRDMWCGMSPSDADIACFEAMTCQQMETEIHAGHFPCIGGH